MDRRLNRAQSLTWHFQEMSLTSLLIPSCRLSNRGEIRAEQVIRPVEQAKPNHLEVTRGSDYIASLSFESEMVLSSICPLPF